MTNKFFVLIVLSLLMSCKNQNSAQEENKVERSDMTHNSKNSLDWNGTYRGILPCADCEGIKTEVTLHKNQTYESARKYLGEGDRIFQESGRFEWNEAGSAITLLNEEEASETKYQVGENNLTMLNANGDPVKGKLSKMYILKKVAFDQEIKEKYWKLMELRGKKIPAPETGRREPHFVLKADENRVIGNGGCNSLMGSYNLEDGNKIKFSKVASTEMACMEVTYENEFLKVFEVVDSYSIRGDTLSLNSADTSSLAKFTAVYFY